MTPKYQEEDPMLKSAYEMALERAGGEAVRKLSDRQRTQLAEIDAKYKALIAEKEILLSDRIQDARLQGDLEAVQALQNDLVEERRRLEEARNREKNRVREEDPDRKS
jgi:predicted nuclease with TOPRIM domain